MEGSLQHLLGICILLTLPPGSIGIDSYSLSPLHHLPQAKSTGNRKEPPFRAETVERGRQFNAHKEEHQRAGKRIFFCPFVAMHLTSLNCARHFFPSSSWTRRSYRLEKNRKPCHFDDIF